MADPLDTRLDEIIQGKHNGEAKRLGTALQLHETTPEAAARNLAVGRELGVPSGVVGASPEIFQQQVDQRRASQQLSDVPLTRSWIQDYENQQLARDDLENLTWWERHSSLFRQGEARATVQGQKFSRDLAATAETSLLGRALYSAQDQFEGLFLNEDGTPNMAGRLANLARTATQDDPRLVGEPRPTLEERRQAILDKPLNPIGRIAEATLDELEAEGVQPLSFSEIDSFGSAVGFVTENLMASAPHMMATVASGGFSPIMSATLMGGEANAELEEKTDLPLDQRVALAGGAGTVMAGLELFGLGRILGPISPGKLASDALEGTLAKQLVDAGMSNAAARTIQAGLVEGSTEILQEGIIMGVTSAAGGEYAEGEVRDRLINAFAAGAGVGGAMRTGTETVNATTKALGRAAEWARSGQTDQDLTEIDEMATASKLRERSPDKFQAALESAGFDGSVEISAAEVHTYFQGQVSDETLMQLGVDRADFDAMLQVGGEISVPLANYATHFAGSEASSIFHEHGRIDPNEMTVAEARAYEEGLGVEVVQAIEEDMARHQEPVRQIRETIAERLQEQGRKPEVAQAEAQVHGAFWEFLGERLGQGADALAGRFGLEIRGVSDIPPGGATDTGAAAGTPAAEPSPPQQLEQAAAEVRADPAFETFFGASRVTTPDGAPLVVYRGEHGARPEGQDFQTQLGSLTFSSSEAASLYAQDPNDSRMTAEAPQVIPVFLRIENPIIEATDDPFLEYGEIADKLGLDYAVQLARRFSSHIENTGNWMEEIDPNNEMSVGEYLDQNPENVRNLYSVAFPVLDDAQFVEDAKAAGFDGAIHMGIGETDDVEYRVFDPSQAKSIFNRGTFDPNDPNILNQAPVPPVEDLPENTLTHENGEPVILYHGTNQAFDQFNDGLTFFSTQPGLATEHAVRNGLEGARVIKATVALENELTVEVEGDPVEHWLRNAMTIEQQMIDGQHDGVLLYNADGEAVVIATRNDQINQLPKDPKVYNQSEARRNGIGLYSQVEQAMRDLKLPQLQPSKKNPDGSARGPDIWAKLSKEPGIKKEELEWLGLEEWLNREEPVAPQDWTATQENSVSDYIVVDGNGNQVMAFKNYEVDSPERAVEVAAMRRNLEEPGSVPTQPRTHTREEVVAYIQNNGVQVDEIISDQDMQAAEENVTLSDRRVWDDPEAWAHLVEDMLYEWDQGGDPIYADADQFMNDWLMDNIGEVVANYEGSLPEDQQAELQELVDELEVDFSGSESDKRAILTWLEENADATPEIEMRQAAREAFEEFAETAAEAQYMEDPYEIYELTDGAGDSLSTPVYAFGNDDLGWSIRTNDPLQYGNEVEGEIYSLGEAEIQAISYARENDLIHDAESPDLARWGEYVMEGDHDNYREVKLQLPDTDGEFIEDAHFPEENLVAWLRVTDRSLLAPEPVALGEAGDMEVTVQPQGTSGVMEVAARLGGRVVLRKNVRIGEDGNFEGDPTLGGRSPDEAAGWLKDVLGRNGSQWTAPDGNVYRAENGRVMDMNQPTRNQTYFIDEFQSDWHQQGRQHGYRDRNFDFDAARAAESEVSDEIKEVIRPWFEALSVEQQTEVGGFQQFGAFIRTAALEGWNAFGSDNPQNAETIPGVPLEMMHERMQWVREVTPNGALTQLLPMFERYNTTREDLEAYRKGVPDAPFKGDGWLALGVKRALVQAVEQGKTSFAWADADTLVNRWSDRYRTLYETQYDKKMPSLVKKLTKQQPKKMLASGVEKTPEGWMSQFELRSEGADLNDGVETWRWYKKGGSYPAFQARFESEVDARKFLVEEADDLTGRSAFDIVETEEGRFEIVRKSTGEVVLARRTREEVEREMQSFDNQRSVEEGYWIIEITDELREQIMSKSFPLFQDGEPKAPRGRIEIPAAGIGNGDAVIRLFEGADRSTFMHESAHYFLEVMTALEGEAPELAADMATIRKFLDAKEGEAWTTEQHEKFARGFEAYLMEGKAPSLELADVFSSFKAWLTRLYESVLRLNVELNDDIRGVFDRMLASDKQIAEAREQMGMRALFAEKPAGMSDADWSTYQRQARRAEEQAEQRLLKRTMDVITRRTKKWYKEERQGVRDEVEAEVNQRREFRLIEALGNGRWIGEEEVEVPDMRIDRQELVDMFGEEVLAEIDRTKIGGKRAIYGPEGNTPGEVAEFFGFANAVEMMDAIRAAGKRRDVIETQTDAIMDKRYGDPLNDGSIEEEAMLAIHSEQQEAATIAEARELARQIGRKSTGMTRRVYARRAQEMIDGMTVAQASKPTQFLAAERRAAREAQEAFARVSRGGGEKALREAYMAKERQALNQHLYTASKKVETEVNKARQRMMNYRKASVRAKLDGGYIEQIDALLEGYDFRKRSPGELRKTASLKDYIDRMIEEGREAELNIDQRLLDEANRKHYSQLTVDELNGLLDTIANIDHMGRFKQKLIDRKRKRDLAKSAQRAAVAIRSSQKVKKPSKKPDRTLQALNLLSKPDTIMIRMDGGDEFGDFYNEVKRGIDESVGIETEMQRKAAEDLHDLYSKYYTPRELRSFQKPKQIKGVANPWSKHEILAIAMNVGNRDNFQRILAQDTHPSRRLDEHQLKLLLTTLTDHDWRFVQAHIDLINTLWPDLAEVHNRRTGTKAKKVEAEVMIDYAPAFFKGGYYPIKYDPSLSQAAARDEQTATDKYMTAGHGSTASVGNGMTKAREKSGGGRTLQYDLAVGFKHIRDTVRYIALSEAVDNSYRVLNHPDVVAAMQETGNLDTHQTLNLWLQDAAQGPIFNSDLGNTLARVAKNNFTLSRLAFNMKTIILQTTGISQSAAVIGKRNMARGLLRYWRNPAGTLADIEAISPKMRERKSTFQKDMYDFLNATEDTRMFESQVEGARRFIGQAGFLPIVAMQYYVVDVPTWTGAYTKALADGKSQEQAALEADKMVERAQDTGLQTERSAVERGTLSKTTRQADMVRLFTTLGGYMLTKLNRAGVTTLQGRQAIREADTMRGKFAAATNMALDLFILFAFEAVVMGVMYELLDEDDDTDDLNEFLLRETGMAMVAGVPLVRDAASAFNGYGGGGVYGSVMEVPANFYTQVGQGEWDRAMRRSIADIIGITTGLPTTASTRLIERLAEPNDVTLSEALLGTNPLDR